jgi:succinate-semialdehyde dehydrogenase/glutarate-semialdehyde dehydrogenase
MVAFIEKSFIKGKWVEATSGKKINVFNPANGQAIGQVPLSSGDDANQAIAAAATAFPSWSKQLAKERAKILRKLYDLMLVHKEDFARTMVIEQGKSIHEARSEFDYALEFVLWFAEEARRIYGEVVPPIKHGQRLLTIRQPIGVTAAITPWNFPLAMIVRKAIPALAAGCSIIVKPSEETPFTAFLLAKLAQEAGIPDGVLNVLCGDAAAIGDVLTSSSTVRMLSFTGSTAVGKLLMAKAAQTVKKVALELGGNAPFIVFADADLEKAAAGLIASKLRNGGQSCICANRVYVHESIASDFVKLLQAGFSQIKVGDGLDESNKLGAMINQAAVDKIQNLIADAQAHGGQVLYAADLAHLKGGCFVPPTIILNKQSGSKIEETEIFGPVASIFTFKSDEGVLKRANNTNYGLAAYFYTQDKERIWRFAEELEYGMVAVNDVVLSSEVTCFGGVKESGIGREGGRTGINEFLEEKFIAMS